MRSRFRMLAIVGSLLGACSFPDYGFVPQFTGGTGAGGSGGSGLTAGSAGDGGSGAVPNGGSSGSNGSGAGSGDAGMAGDAAGGSSAGGAGGSTSDGAGAGGEGGSFEPPPPLLCDAIEDVPEDCTCVDHNDHAYFFCTSSYPFGTAANLCGEYGLRLVKIDSFSEDEWIKDESQADGLSGPWIGANSRDTPGTWTWPDGEVFWIGDQSGTSQGGNYAMWNTGHPGWASAPSCAYVGQNGWDSDPNCSNNRHWICEAY